MGLLSRMSTPVKSKEQGLFFGDQKMPPNVGKRVPRASTNENVIKTQILAYNPSDEDKKYYDKAYRFFENLKQQELLKNEIIENPAGFLMTLTKWLKEYNTGNVSLLDVFKAMKEHYINPEKLREFNHIYGAPKKGGRHNSNKKTAKRSRRNQSKTKRNLRK